MGVGILLVASDATETEISSGGMDHLARRGLLPYKLEDVSLSKINQPQ